ncbi:MAG: rnr [Planctomycetaceae bacterium]|nr:rnr [Planctomycetaceae bacterium]
MSPLAQQILSYVDSVEFQPCNPAHLAKQIGVTKNQIRQFKEAVIELMESEHLRQQSNGLLRRKQQSKEQLVTGIIRRAAAGFGFLTPTDAPHDRSQDIYVAQEDLKDAQSGDEVSVRLMKSDRRDGKPRGRVVEVIQRDTHVFVGTYFESNGRGCVQIDGTAFTEPIDVGDPGAKGVQPKDKVVIEMLRFPSHRQTGEAVLTQVLGPRGQPGVDTLGIIHEYGLPEEFSPEVLANARLQADQFDENDIAGRLDLTEETIITIDPVDARDFDDAISLQQSEDGHWHLSVHIADVAHFVPVGSALDAEAQSRATSIYLPDRVIPMLPEILSNGLASLQQGRLRYTKSAIMEFTAEGIPVHTEFANSAIRVTQRFAYEEVMPIIEHPEKHRGKVSLPVRKLLNQMYEFAMVLRRRRFKAGALELSMPETKLEFDAAGKVNGAHAAHHDASHEIIEEFMLAANIAVATAIADLGLPFIRRTHGDPDELKLRRFGEFVGILGLELTSFQSRHALQALLKQVYDMPIRQAVNYALLRSMKQAEYSVEELGHYALSEENYCHFTSPIRRYPDLTVHRLIGALATRKNGKGRKGKLPKSDIVVLGALARHCSAMERRAAYAERELVKIKLLTYMSERIGEELDTIITGVQDFGFFCQGIDIPAEGLVHVTSLVDDYYYYEDASQTLIGRRTGQQYRLGSPVKVVVARVDIDRRQLDFRLAGTGTPPDKSTTAPMPFPLKSGPQRERKSKSSKGKKKR